MIDTYHMCSFSCINSTSDVARFNILIQKPGDGIALTGIKKNQAHGMAESS